jgi:hypothetical protein
VTAKPVRGVSCQGIWSDRPPPPDRALPVRLGPLEIRARTRGRPPPRVTDMEYIIAPRVSIRGGITSEMACHEPVGRSGRPILRPRSQPGTAASGPASPLNVIDSLKAGSEAENDCSPGRKGNDGEWSGGRG